MALSAAFLKLVAILMVVVTLLASAPVVRADDGFESFDDAWEVTLLEEGPRSLGRRSLLGRYDPLPPQAKGNKQGAPDSGAGNPGKRKGNGNGNDNN